MTFNREHTLELHPSNGPGVSIGGEEPEPKQRPSTRTERVLQAVAYAAARLLHSDSWEECIEESLGRRGHATGAAQAFLLQTSPGDGALNLNQRYAWQAANLTQPVDFDTLPLADWANDTFSNWTDELRRGNTVHGLAEEFPPAQRRLLQELGLYSLQLLPVFVGPTWWGLIVLHDRTRSPAWSATEMDALRVAADSLGTAIGRRQAELKLHHRNHELAVLNSVIAAATTTLEPHTVLATTCRELARAFKVPQAGAALLDESGLYLEIVAEYTWEDGASVVGAKIPIKGNPATQYVLQHMQPLVLDDVQNDPRMASVRELMQRRQVASMLLLPLVAGDQVLGTLGLDSPSPYHFGDEEVALAMSAVAAASQVLAKARLLAAEQENVARLQKILQLSTTLAGIRDEQTLLQTLVQSAVAFAGSAICTAFLVDDADPDHEAAVVMRAQQGLGDELLGMRAPLDHPLVQRALAMSEPLIVPDIDHHAPELRAFLVRPDIHSFAAFAFVAETGPIGFITFSGLFPRRPSAAEVSALGLLAERTAAALQNVRLLNAVRAQAAQLAALHQVDMAIGASLEPQEVYHTITHSAASLLHCDLVNLYRWNADLDQLEGLATSLHNDDFAHSMGRRSPLRSNDFSRYSVKGKTFDGDKEPLLPTLRTAQQPIAIRDATHDERVAPFWREKFGMRAVLLVPLLYHDSLSGLLAFNDTRQTRHWTPAEIELAQSLAAQAAIAVANARLHDETRLLLQRSREQTRIVQQVVDSVPDGLLLLDPQRRVVVANPVAQEFLELLGHQEKGRLQKLGGVPLSHLLRPPAVGRLFHELVVERPQSRIFELGVQQMEAEPLAGGWVLVLHEATHEREQLAYLQARDRLATVGQLAAGIAHDFNNILAVIVLYAQTLQRADVPPRDRERLAAIYQQAQRATSLIGQILDFSRRAVVERQPLELPPFLADLGRMLQRTLPETISLEFDPNAVYDDADRDHDLYVVNVDPTRLQQALMNLALNARDAMPRGGVLRMALAHYGPQWSPPLPDMQPGDWIAIGVSDSGAGIKPEVLPHIFEPFFTTKGPGQGTGLGLAQVYGIVKQHDGFIDVHSRPGAGATFTIYLRAFALLPAPGPIPQAALHSANDELILVVEDDPAIQTVVGEILELLNYRVLLASDGAEALTVYGEARDEIDLVLSDMVMPRLDGARLHHALRAQNPQVKMVLFTGYPLDEAGKTFVEEQGVAWIQKPFTSEQLNETIRRTLMS